jgi:hypothetical protein
MTGTVLQVGDGRGFVIETEDARYVVTAAHCLDVLPPADGLSDTAERTYRDFLGPLNGTRNVWAECAFVDPVADIAVFCEPDGQELYDEWRAYQELTGNATPFPLGSLRFRRPLRNPDGRTIRGYRKATSSALMLSLDGEWFACRITGLGRSLWIEGAAQPIRPGMSGSPIILPDGSAVGVECVSTEGERGGGPNPLLSANLPAWLARDAQ